MTAGPKSHGRLSIAASAAPRELMGPRAAVDAWRAHVVTLFPELFPGPLGASLTGKALKDGLWDLRAFDLRRHGIGRHRNVDDTPFGGGAGMVMRPDVVSAALVEAGAGRLPGIVLSPSGRPFTQGMARRLAAGPGVVLLCGRFEGIDARVIEAHALEEVSVGDAVLTGGEIPAMALIDACVRLRGGVLGNPTSAEEESFSDGLLEAPHYTRPPVWEGRAVPEVLLSGHHGAIRDWRRHEAERLTKERRPDLWRARHADGDGDQSDGARITRGINPP